MRCFLAMPISPDAPHHIFMDLFTYFVTFIMKIFKAHKIYRLIKISIIKIQNVLQDFADLNSFLLSCNFVFLAGHFKVKHRYNVISSINISAVCKFCAHVQQETGAKRICSKY